ncbi:MAG: phosphate ABC transporter permease [Xenococcaceae cyanobacterium MO_188.B32]|nr:phosphate ABC transporter permease [Xenococcaceae cyanobacterium MO_188.B32]
MLISLTREKFEQIIPLIATGPQYAYYWGKWQDLLNRLLVSVVAIVVILLFNSIVGEGAHALVLLLAVIGGLYWLWAPVYWASLRNTSYRKYKYCGFWQARILEIFITEDLLREEETVNERGELVIIENRERRINLVLGDETGFEAEVNAPLQRIHKAIKTGQTAQLLVLSNQPNLARIDKITDAYIPSQNLWIGEYPWLQRDVFSEVSLELERKKRPQYGDRPRGRYNQRRR